MQVLTSFILNDIIIQTFSEPSGALADFIRYERKLTGTKISCREGDCGACTVIIGELIEDKISYKNINSCIFPLYSAGNRHIVTIEGLNSENLTPIQKEFVVNNAAQCGFCTPGFINSLTCFFLSSPVLDVNHALKYISGNICRCTGYFSIIRAIDNLLKNYSCKISLDENRINSLIEHNFIPQYFKDIKIRLYDLKTTEATEELTNPELIIAGGTDLFVQQYPSLKNSVNKFIISENRFAVKRDENRVIINASSSIEEILTTDVMKSEFYCSGVIEALFGSLQIRNRATAGGNIVNASPIGDFTIFLLSLDTVLHIKGEKGLRNIYLKDFYKGYKQTVLERNEIIEKISFSIPSENSFSNFIKISRREHLDIASVNSAFFLTNNGNITEHCRISAGGVAPVPKLLEKSSEFLTGKVLTEETISAAAEIALKEISPISDARGSASYKSSLLMEIIFEHFNKFREQYV